MGVLLIDYSYEVKLVKSPLVRLFFVSIAVVSLILAVIGVFLPVLPTTPFVLLSAACYGKSSVRFYNWLMNHGIFGPPLREWKVSGAIGRRYKILAIGMIGLSVGVSIAYYIPLLSIKIGLGLFAGALVIFIATRPEGRL